MQQSQQGQGQLVILHFNDAYDIQKDPNDNLGFINFYDHLQKMRTLYPKSLLVFSGDAFAPSRLSRVHQGWQMVKCLKMLKIDVACYGNHDFDFHPDHALKLAKACEFPWLMGNIKYPETNQNIGEGLDYYISETAGIKIGFMGLAGPDFKGRLISDYKQLKYINVVDHAKATCKILRQKNCSLIIALNHMRMPADQQLAKKVPQIDIILGGHDHARINELVNEIPIVKSGSNFQSMSIVKIFKGVIKAGREKNVRLGRRWNFQIQCKLVKKSTNLFPQLQEYIENCVTEYRQYDKAKSIASNKPKNKVPQMPKDNWIIKYQLINNRPTVSVTAGLSAEVCFAKYVAFKRGYFYSGYQKYAPTLSINYIQTALKAIQSEILSHKNNGKTILYSPGICNVPYLIETGNFVYLPSQLLVGVNSINELQQMLKYSLWKGYKCYAVLGYDPFISDKLCAWIKFSQPPQQYINIARQLKIQNIIFMSVHDAEGQNHGDERISRLLYSLQKQQKRQYPVAGDIYMIFVQQSYLKNNNKDISIFQKLIKDRTTQYWIQISQKPASMYIHDWQSGIDCVKHLQKAFRIGLNQQKLQCYYILNRDSWNLYVTSYHLGKKFIQKNYNQEKRPQKFCGVVFNQYIMSNPTYQLNYGYIPILYWQFYPKNQERILKMLTQQQKSLKRWFNMHKGTRIGLINHTSFKILTDHEGIQLAKWTTKHAPPIYEHTFLEINQVLSTLIDLQLLYHLQGQSFKKIQ